MRSSIAATVSVVLLCCPWTGAAEDMATALASFGPVSSFYPDEPYTTPEAEDNRWRTVAPDRLDQRVFFVQACSLNGEAEDKPEYWSTTLGGEGRNYLSKSPANNNTLANNLGYRVNGYRYDFDLGTNDDEVTLSGFSEGIYGTFWSEDQNNEYRWFLNGGERDDAHDESYSFLQPGFSLGQRLAKDRLFTLFTTSFEIGEPSTTINSAFDVEYTMSRYPRATVDVEPSCTKTHEYDALFETAVWTTLDYDIWNCRLGLEKSHSGVFSDEAPRWFASLEHVVSPGRSYSVSWWQNQYRVDGKFLSGENASVSMIFAW